MQKERAAVEAKIDTCRDRQVMREARVQEGWTWAMRVCSWILSLKAVRERRVKSRNVTNSHSCKGSGIPITPVFMMSVIEV